MKKVISFSLWGDNPKYTVGAIRNAEIAINLYPDWICRFYIGKSVPIEIVKQLSYCSNTEIFILNEPGDWNGMFWRFYAADDSGVDVMLSRDTDSRLSKREKAAVDEWLSSDFDFHIIRDHPGHKTEILGGLWGAKNKILYGKINNFISNYHRGNFWQVDQNFLREKIYPLVKDKALVHDEFFENKPFPIKREGLEFVGEVYSADNEITQSHRERMRRHIADGCPLYIL